MVGCVAAVVAMGAMIVVPLGRCLRASKALEVNELTGSTHLVREPRLSVLVGMSVHPAVHMKRFGEEIQPNRYHQTS